MQHINCGTPLCLLGNWLRQSQFASTSDTGRCLSIGNCAIGSKFHGVKHSAVRAAEGALDSRSSQVFIDNNNFVRMCFKCCCGTNWHVFWEAGVIGVCVGNRGVVEVLCPDTGFSKISKSFHLLECPLDCPPIHFTGVARLNFFQFCFVSNKFPCRKPPIFRLKNNDSPFYDDSLLSTLAKYYRSNMQSRYLEASVMPFSCNLPLIKSMKALKALLSWIRTMLSLSSASGLYTKATLSASRPY